MDKCKEKKRVFVFPSFDHFLTLSFFKARIFSNAFDVKCMARHTRFNLLHVKSVSICWRYTRKAVVGGQFKRFVFFLSSLLHLKWRVLFSSLMFRRQQERRLTFITFPFNVVLCFLFVSFFLENFPSNQFIASDRKQARRTTKYIYGQFELYISCVYQMPQELTTWNLVVLFRPATKKDSKIGLSYLVEWIICIDLTKWSKQLCMACTQHETMTEKLLKCNANEQRKNRLNRLKKRQSFSVALVPVMRNKFLRVYDFRFSIEIQCFECEIHVANGKLFVLHLIATNCFLLFLFYVKSFETWFSLFSRR